MNVSTLVEESIASLNTLVSALDRVSDEQYADFDEAVFRSSIGLHVRHVLDHYMMFFAGLPDGLVNYDARPRELIIETSRQAALERISLIIEKLQQLIQNNVAVDVIMDVRLDVDSSTEPMPQTSSLSRELAFLHSHATHHYAILVYIFRTLGIASQNEDFGFAPATVRHLRAI